MGKLPRFCAIRAFVDAELMALGVQHSKGWAHLVGPGESEYLRKYTHEH